MNAVIPQLDLQTRLIGATRPARRVVHRRAEGVLPDDGPQNPCDCDRWLVGDLHGEFHRSLFEYCDRMEFTNEADCQRRGPMEVREI
jgi:hypothetical protein